MEIVAFANNQALSAKDAEPSVIWTDPHPVGDANYIQVAFNVPVLFSEAGNPTLSYQMQGSNDGQSWFDISSFTDSTGGPLTDPKPKGGDVTCAFVRVEISLSADAGNGITSGNFDLHANFTRK